MESTIIHKQQLKKLKQEAERLRPQVEKWLKREYRDLVGPLSYALARGADEQREAEAGDLSGRLLVVYETMLNIQGSSDLPIQRGQIVNRMTRELKMSVAPITITRDLHELARMGLVVQYERERAWFALRVEVSGTEDAQPALRIAA